MAVKNTCTPVPPKGINHAKGLLLKAKGNRHSELLMFLAPFQLLFKIAMS